MKDLVQKALEYDEPMDDSEVVDVEGFGPPQVLYVGYGNAGIKRVRLGVAPRGNHTDSNSSVTSVVTSVGVHSESTLSRNEPGQIDHYIDEPQALADLNIDTDCCMITADVDDPSAVADVLAITDAVDDGVTLAFLRTDGEYQEAIARQLHGSVGTTVVVQNAESQFHSIESLPEPGSTADRLIRRLVTDFTTLIVGPNLGGVSYAEVWDQWESGRGAVPFVAQFDESETHDSNDSLSLSLGGSTGYSSGDWIGYAWIRPSVTLADFEQVKQLLDAELGSRTETHSGILGSGVDDQLESEVFVTGVRFGSH